jgi:hypothetical protein
MKIAKRVKQEMRPILATVGIGIVMLLGASLFLAQLLARIGG